MITQEPRIFPESAQQSYRKYFTKNAVLLWRRLFRFQDFLSHSQCGRDLGMSSGGDVHLGFHGNQGNLPSESWKMRTHDSMDHPISCVSDSDHSTVNKINII